MFNDQKDVTSRSDWLMARQAVYEGDSSLLMTLWASENFTPAEFSDLLAQGLIHCLYTRVYIKLK